MPRVPRRSLIAASAALLLAGAPVHPQTFLEDFYNAAGGGQTNVTAPGIYEAAGYKAAIGGGYVFKAPRREFRPLTATPPSLRQGCGGIDLFLGSFSIPSREEFILFLRNIGQNLPGLAFELALKSLSPELQQLTDSYKQFLMQLTQGSISSCEAAKWLLDKSGASQALESAGERVRGWGVQAGVWSDRAAAKDATRADGGAIRNQCDNVELTDDFGGVHYACQMNLTWSLLSSGQWSGGASAELRRLVMSLVGTQVVRFDDAGANSVLRSIPFAPTLLPVQLVGDLDLQQLDGVFWYRCADNETYCLDPQRVAYQDSSLASLVYRAASNYRSSILARDPSLVTAGDVWILGSATSIPMLRVVAATSGNRFRVLGENVIRVFSEAVAYELAVRFLDDLLQSAEQAALAKEVTGPSTLIVDAAKAQIEQIRNRRRELFEASRSLDSKISRASSMLTLIEHLERTLQSNLSAELAANLRFSETTR